MGDEIVATYYYNHKKYNIYGCWDEETPENQYDFYDIYDGEECINLGEPFYKLPTRDELIEFINQ